MKKVLLEFVIVLLAALIAAIPALADPPAASGPYVVRFEDGIGFWYPDEAKGLSATLGFVNVVNYCAGDENFDLMSVQQVSVPEDADRIVEIIHGDDISVTIWPFSDFDCDLFTTMEPVASGTADLISTDNDLIVWMSDDNVNWNAFGFSLHGNLTTPDGDTVRYNGVSRCLWDGNNDDTLRCVDRINLISRGRS